jgi:hypothetical protein
VCQSPQQSNPKKGEMGVSHRKIPNYLVKDHGLLTTTHKQQYYKKSTSCNVCCFERKRKVEAMSLSAKQTIVQTHQSSQTLKQAQSSTTS